MLTIWNAITPNQIIWSFNKCHVVQHATADNAYRSPLSITRWHCRTVVNFNQPSFFNNVLIRAGKWFSSSCCVCVCLLSSALIIGVDLLVLLPVLLIVSLTLLIISIPEYLECGWLIFVGECSSLSIVLASSRICFQGSLAWEAYLHTSCCYLLQLFFSVTSYSPTLLVTCKL